METEPKHCKGCWNFNSCKQKAYMLADTQPVKGFVAEADVWCEDCKQEGDESLQYYSESDTPLHCAECGVPIQCSLTDYGVDYVKTAVAAGDGCCQELWPELFRNYLE